MKSHKIRRLEFVSDKIEGGDYKREVVCTRFVHGRATMARVGAPWLTMGSSPEGKGERGRHEGL
jgi:hypothetical protein